MMKLSFSRALAILTLTISSAVWADGPTTAQSPLPVEIKASSAEVARSGRFVAGDDAVRCQWSASQVSLAFEGTDVQVRLTDEGGNFFEVELDGKVVGSFKPFSKKTTVVDLGRGLPAGRHLVRVMKRTEAFCGAVSFEAFLLSGGGKALTPPPAKHRIEVIGDSISCGYGNEGKSEKEHFLPATENAYMTYGAITARAFDAEYACIAWSGQKMWPDHMLPDRYDLAFPTDSTSKWDFSTWKPEVVLINLATNDFGKQNPDRDGWIKAYEAFVKRVRGNYPGATIYLALGSMMSDSYPKGNKALSTAREYLQQIHNDLTSDGDANIKLIEFPTQNAQRDGLGSDYHPSIKTQQRMAQQWIAAIQSDLKWEPAGK